LARLQVLGQQVRAVEKQIKGCLAATE
jgi:hypothetical protein